MGPGEGAVFLPPKLGYLGVKIVGFLRFYSYFNAAASKGADSTSERAIKYRSKGAARVAGRAQSPRPRGQLTP